MKAITKRPIVVGMTDKNNKRVNQTSIPEGTLVYVRLYLRHYGPGHLYEIRVPGTLLTQIVHATSIKKVK